MLILRHLKQSGVGILFLDVGEVDQTGLVETIALALITSAVDKVLWIELSRSHID